MKTTLLPKLHLTALLLFCSFQSFCQFGERQVIHEDEGEPSEYVYLGVYDFDNDNVNEAWYRRVLDNTDQVLFIMDENEFREIAVEGSQNWPIWNDQLVADLNEDGLLDIIFRNEGRLFILLNEGELKFSSPVEIQFETLETEFFNYTFDDFDQDGLKDLLIYNYQKTTWLKNLGNGEFAASQSIDNINQAVGDIQFSDLNGDNINEIIVPAINNVNIYTKVGDSYELENSIPSNLGETVQVVVVDINKDNQLDLIVRSVIDYEQRLTYYENDQNSFDEGTIIYSGYYINNIVPSDVDDDNDIDILLKVYADYNFTGNNNQKRYFSGFLLLENDGSNTFNLQSLLSFIDGDLVDVNSDGRLDVIQFNKHEWVEIIDFNSKIYQHHLFKKHNTLGKVYNVGILTDFENTQVVVNFEKSLYVFRDIQSQPQGKIIRSSFFVPFELGLLDVINNDVFLGYSEYLTLDSDRGYRIEYLKYNSEYDTYTLAGDVQYDDYIGITKINAVFLNDDLLPDLILDNDAFNESNIYEFNDNRFINTINTDFTNDVISRNGTSEAFFLTNDQIQFYDNSSIIDTIHSIGGSEFLDLDGDGDLDVIDINNLVWFENSGNFNYSESVSLELSVVSKMQNLEYCFFDLDLDKDADFVSFSNDSLYWQENLDGKGDFSEKKLIDNISASVVTSGDIDQDGDEDLLIGGDGFIYWYENTSEPIEPSTLSLNLTTMEALQGDTLEIPVKTSDYSRLKSLAFSISWDSEIVDFESVNQFGLEGMQEEDFDLSMLEDGKLGMRWQHNEGVDLTDDQTLFVIKLKLIGEELLATELSFGDEPIAIQAQNAADQVVIIERTVGSITISESKAPNDINLSENSIEENQPAGTVVGTLSTKDEDDFVGFSYAFLEGDNDNAYFKIINTNQLVSDSIFDYEEKPSFTISIETTDSRGKTFQKSLEVEVVDVDESSNNAPTGILLSNQSIDENLEPGTLIGAFSTFDEDEDDTHIYSSVEGEGSEDNDAFFIENDKLYSLQKFDYEEKDSLQIRIQTDDGEGGKYSQRFVIKVNDVEEAINHAPTDIALSSQTITENAEIPTIVAELSTSDPDAADTHTYALVNGAGSNGNAYFSIEGKLLLVHKSFDYEKQKQTSIRIATKDEQGDSYQKSFVIFIEDIVDDENEAPTDLALSNTLVNENAAVNTVVGEFTATDTDDTEFTYSLIAGSGSTHNKSFSIDGNQLLTAETFDYELQDRYTIRVQADDGKGGAYARQFWIDINDVADDPNRFPTAISLSNQSIEENLEIGAVIGKLSTTDPDAEDTHTYKLTDAEDNAFFSIEGNQLLTALVYDFEEENLFVIKVQTDDGRGGIFTQAFVINVIDIEEVGPSSLSISNSSVEENKAVGTVVGTFSASESGTFNYTLVSGTGDDDNGLFAIEGNVLLTDKVFDFETQQAYTVRVKVEDEFENSIEKIFIISIINVNDNSAPTIVHYIEDQTIAAGEAFSFSIPANTFSDPDPYDQLSYSASLGNGEVLPDWLIFDAESITLSGTPNDEESITIRITATDSQGGVISDEFMLIIEGVTAINDGLDKSFKLYPNPIEHYLIIERNGHTYPIQYCRIIDKKGSVLKTWEVHSIKDLEIDLQSLPSGTFIIELVSEKEKLRAQILKK